MSKLKRLTNKIHLKVMHKSKKQNANCLLKYFKYIMKSI